ncbi:MAG: ATP-binding protein [Caldimicrobium sp.]
MNLRQRIKKLIGKAIFGYNLLDEGDRILIALSGGEDSLLLTHFLSEWRYYYNKKLLLYAIHLDMGFPKEEGEYLRKINYLKTFCEEREVNFIFEKTEIANIVLEAFDTGSSAPCFICSWNRRKIFFNLAKDLDIKKIAFGHHKDDVISTFFMNMFYNGELSTMLPKQEMFKGALFLIRPLYFVEKDMISRFIMKENWQILENPCPFSRDTKRSFWNNFLKEHFFSKNPVLKRNVFSAIFNPRLEYLPKKPGKEKDSPQ